MAKVYFECDSFAPNNAKCYVDPETKQGKATLMILSAEKKLEAGAILPGLIYEGHHIALKRPHQRTRSGRYCTKIQMIVSKDGLNTYEDALAGIQIEATKRGYERAVLYPRDDKIKELTEKIVIEFEKGIDADQILAEIKASGRL
ncbi:MAG: hypothetical protein V1836_02055 [Candidatus Aenigmatarchaeota archaeon]